MLGDSPSGAILPPWVAEPYRLHSLGEIVRQFKPELFVPLSQIFTIWRMTAESTKDAGILPNESLPTVDAVLFTFANELEEIGLPVSLVAARRALAYVREGAPTWSRLKELCDDLERRANDEMQSVLFFSVQPQLSEFYAAPRKGWEAVVNRFLGAVYDIEEAGKCMAFHRHTAVVFHLMRVLEIGLEVLKEKIGVTAFSPGWEAATNQIRSALSKTAKKDQTPAEREGDALLQGILDRFLAMKDAVRNPTMHAANRTYTGDEAEEVYAAVRAFMRHLVSNLTPLPPSEPA